MAINTLTLEAGKYYRTRDGRKALVGAGDPFKSGSACSVAGFIDGSGLTTWTPDGFYYADKCASEKDLISEWIEPKRIKGKMFICESVSGVFGSYIGDEPKDPLGAKVIACIEIDVLEGHGLNGEAA